MSELDVVNMDSPQEEDNKNNKEESEDVEEISESEEMVDDEEEIEDDEEDNEEEGIFVVEEIQDVKHRAGTMVFLTKWKTSGELTWEPLSSFPDGLGYHEFDLFKEKSPANLAKFNNAHTAMQKYLSKKKTVVEKPKKWTYEVLDEDMFEQVDTSIKSRDVKGLKDPNRLKDKDEEFLYTYQDGSRLSRSKAREIKQNIKSPQKQASSVRATEVPKPEKKKRGPGRKKKTTEDEPSSSMTADPAPKLRKPRGRKKKEVVVEPVPVNEKPTDSATSAVEPDRQASVESENALSRNLKKAEEWKQQKKKQRIGQKKLNSSSESEGEENSEGPSDTVEKRKPMTFLDVSSSDEEVTEKKKAKKTSTSAASSPEREKVAPKAKASPAMPRTAKAATSVPPVQSSSSSIGVTSATANPILSTEFARKRIPKKRQAPEQPTASSPALLSSVHCPPAELNSFGKNPKIRYEDDVDDEDHDTRPEIKFFGLQRYRGTNETLLSSEMLRRRSKQQFKTLQLAIAHKHLDSVHVCLADMNPIEVLKTIRESSSPDGRVTKNLLHSLLRSEYRAFDDRSMTEVYKKETGRQCTEIIKAVFNYVPIELLADQDELGDSLLHHALYNKLDSLVLFLVEFGAPLHIRNQDNLTPIAAAYTQFPEMLEYLIKAGGAFHHLLEEYISPVFEEDLFYFRSFIIYKVPKYQFSSAKIEEIYPKILKCCRDNWDQCNNKGFANAKSFGPVVFMDRGKVPGIGLEHCVQFKYPTVDEHMNSETRYMLLVMQMMWDDAKGTFVTNKLSPIMKRLPQISGTNCIPAFRYDENKENAIFFQATNAVETHMEAVRKALELRSENYYKYEREALETMKRRLIEDCPIADVNPKPITRPFSSDILTVSIHLESQKGFPFIACQLVKYELTKPQQPAVSRHNSGRPLNPSHGSNGGRWSGGVQSGQPFYQPPANNSLLSPDNPIYHPVDPLQDVNQPGPSSYNHVGPSTSSNYGPY